MAANNIVTLTQENFAAEVLKASSPVLVDFWAEWCGPCKMIGPILDELATEYGGRVKIGKVNIDEHQTLATEYGVRAIPTLLLFITLFRLALNVASTRLILLDTLDQSPGPTGKLGAEQIAWILAKIDEVRNSQKT